MNKQTQVGKNTFTRTSIPATASFLAIPEAFPSADKAVRNALKLEFWTSPAKAPDTLQVEVSTNAALIDLGAVNPSALDAKKIIRDCEFVKQIATSHPRELKELLKALQSGTNAGVTKANEIAERIGFTEEEAIKAGGGLFFLVVVAAAALIGAGCSGANKQKVNSPAYSTTPGQPK